MGSNARIAMAVGMGYLLGRRKKLRTAMAVGAAIAAGRFSRDPMSLLQRGGELLGGSSALGQVSGLSKPLAAAGKAAAAGVVSRQIDSMGDRLKRRTDALRAGGEETEPPEDEEQTESGAEERAERGGNGRAKGRPARESRADADDEYDEDDYDEEDEGEEEDEPEEERRPPARRRAPQAKTDGGDGSQARRAGRAAPVRRRVSNR